MTAREDWPPEVFDTAPSSPPLLVRPMPWEQLLKPVDNSENLLGDRFLERGRGVLLYGPAGCGKSVAALQAVVHWAAGLDGLHIRPNQPLKSVIIQTEDSLNDTRESLAGILEALPPDALCLVKMNLIILEPVPSGTGQDLRRLMDAAAMDHKPDMMLVNPLLAFCPGDPTRELGGLLYQVIDPLIKRHRLGFMGVHHTTKTNNRDTSGYGAHDHQYLAAGDARVANWPRAMIQIEPVATGIYRFRIAKRWRRAGWTWDQKPTAERFFKHAEKVVRWVDATAEEAITAVTTGSVADYRCILDVLPGQDAPGICRDRVRALAKGKLDVGSNKADSWLKLAIEDNLVERLDRPKADTKRTEAVFRKKQAPIAA